MKTSVGEKLAEEFRLTHVSVQSLLADYLAENSGEEDAAEIRRRLAAGQQPPDDITSALLAARLSRKDAKELGMVLDGYPCNEHQVAYLRNSLALEPTTVFLLDCSDSFVFAEQRFVDPVSGRSLTLEAARASGDHALEHRISRAAEENREALQNHIERWELTRRTLVKHFEHQTVSVSIEDKSEQQIFEEMAHIMRKKF